MDLPVHRTMLFCGLRRAATRVGRVRGTNVVDTFHPLWLGNWLTDMNQATAFFDAAEKRVDPYARWHNGRYALPSTVTDNAELWTKLFQSLWLEEWKGAAGLTAFRGLPDTGARPQSADDVGGYDPYDHGDVVDRLDANGSPILDEHLEFEPASRTGMTRTASEMIFVNAVDRWLFPAFQTAPRDRATHLPSLSNLGHATHVLADFFGHSNYVEVALKLAAGRGYLPSDCAELIQSEEFGTFTSYQSAADPARTVIQTGRFDRIDLIASLLGIYRAALVPSGRDLADGGFQAGQASSHRDLVFEVLFDTFSNTPFEKALSQMKALSELNEFVEKVGATVQRGLIHIASWVAGSFLEKPAEKAALDDLTDLAIVANSTPAADYARMGRLVYLEHVIEGKLRDELARASGPKLPHHALINKDHDLGDPEGRLVHKLACCLATDVTTDVLALYFGGADFKDVRPVLERYYRHPATFVDAPAFRASLVTAIDRMYGIRWWQCADDDSSRLALA